MHTAAWRGRRPCRRVSTLNESSLMPWWLSNFRACSDWAHLTITPRTCSPAERWFVMVTPSILMVVTRRIAGICGGRPTACLRLQFVNMISVDLILLSLRLLFCAGQWRRNYGDRGYIVFPPSLGLVPPVPPSKRCGLCQNFKQTTLTTRLYKVRTKRSDVV